MKKKSGGGINDHDKLVIQEFFGVKSDLISVLNAQLQDRKKALMFVADPQPMIYLQENKQNWLQKVVKRDNWKTVGTLVLSPPSNNDSSLLNVDQNMWFPSSDLRKVNLNNQTVLFDDATGEIQFTFENPSLSGGVDNNKQITVSFYKYIKDQNDNAALFQIVTSLVATVQNEESVINALNNQGIWTQISDNAPKMFAINNIEFPAETERERWILLYVKETYTAYDEHQSYQVSEKPITMLVDINDDNIKTSKVIDADVVETIGGLKKPKYHAMTVKELQEIARKKKIPYSGLNKSQLIFALESKKRKK